MQERLQGGYQATGGVMLENLLMYALSMFCFFSGVYCGIKIERD